MEAYQGIYGIMTDYPPAFKLAPDGAAMLSELRSWIETNRPAVADEEELQNIIDETLELISSSIYKLKFLS
jgi:hypothetical protein